MILYRTGLLWIILILYIFRLRLSYKLHTYVLFYKSDIMPYVDKYHHFLRPSEHPQQGRSRIFWDLTYKMKVRI